MDNFKIWILSVCGASAITSLCRLIVSKSKLKKTTNIFFSLFIFLYMLLPFANADYNIFKDFDEESEISSDVDYKNGYDMIVSEAIKQICKENKIDIISLNIDSYVNEDGNLYVDSIFLNIDDKSRIKEIETIIKKKTGFEVNVT